MEGIKNLKFNMTYHEFMEFQMKFESQTQFVLKVLFDSFTGDERMNNQNLNRYIVVSAELLMLDDAMIVEYTDEKERDELRTRLTNEAQILRSTIEALDENKGDVNLRKGGENNKFERFDAKLTLLSNI